MLPLQNVPVDSSFSYPIGKFDVAAPFSAADRAAAVADIAALPARLREAATGLTDAQLDTPYRPGGWTVRQVVHHVADSHMHALARFKLALTEDEPTVKPYEEAPTAELADYALPVASSLDLLTALHLRWATLLTSLTDEQWMRTLYHPALGRVVLSPYAGSYAWHGRHHTAHITRLRERAGW